MRPLHYLVAVTLDGFVADPDGGLDAFVMQGDHVDHYLASLRGYDTIVMGRKTYDVGRSHGVLDPYPWARTYVASRSETSPTPRVTFVADPIDTVRALRSEAGDAPIYLAGGGELAATLQREGLIDEVHLKINPSLLGRGVPLFAPDVRASLSLRATKTFESGVVLAEYVVR
ncbi:MAG: dihydrofolate reductase [Sandaracinus sp.]|nr:dihydrofolate reductase [Myxococcales bacterium]MCB9603102.1 dihydrofolate reductase [Sandaracinus sp.]MCB9613331.1 dihydrofolate reductase [Sandaracinus sp.]MCB9632182.1 dihydrofolate reductase [Sandaracinus sp.]